MKLDQVLKFGFLFLSLVLGLIIGNYFILNSWNGETTARVYLQGRVVADTVRPVQKSILINQQITNRENIISSLSVSRDPKANVIGLQFGNYLTEKGQSLCSAFGRIEVILFGDGLAVSGEAPRIIVEGACPSNEATEVGSIGLKIETIFPIFLISECQKPQSDDLLTFDNGTEIKMTNVDFALSEPDWIIEKITFFDENNNLKMIEFDNNQIKQILSKKRAQSEALFIKVICE